MTATLDAYLDRDLMGATGDVQFEGLHGSVLRGAGFAGRHGGTIEMLTRRGLRWAADAGRDA